MPAQAGIQSGGSSGIKVSGRSRVPRTRETSLRAATSILDARLRGHDNKDDQRPAAVTRIPRYALLPGYEDATLSFPQLPTGRRRSQRLTIAQKRSAVFSAS